MWTFLRLVIDARDPKDTYYNAEKPANSDTSQLRFASFAFCPRLRIHICRFADASRMKLIVARLKHVHLERDKTQLMGTAHNNGSH